MIQNESRDPFGGNVYNVTMQITFLKCQFRNGERNLHCDIVHITTNWVSSLTLDCNGVFAIKAYGNQFVDRFRQKTQVGKKWGTSDFSWGTSNFSGLLIPQASGKFGLISTPGLSR